jgi:hypothetical protein
MAGVQALPQQLQQQTAPHLLLQRSNSSSSDAAKQQQRWPLAGLHLLGSAEQRC